MKMFIISIILFITANTIDLKEYSLDNYIKYSKNLNKLSNDQSKEGKFYYKNYNEKLLPAIKKLTK